jgi:uncharacterized repeat protein (TIGR01451 family)
VERQDVPGDTYGEMNVRIGTPGSAGIVDKPELPGLSWANLFDSRGNLKDSLDSSGGIGINLVADAWDLGGLDAVFLKDGISAGLRKDPTVRASGERGWASGVVTPRHDLSNAYLFSRTDPHGDLTIYFGSERLAGGEGYVQFELNRQVFGLNHEPPCETGDCQISKGERSTGDLLVTIRFSRDGWISSSRVDAWQDSTQRWESLRALPDEGCTGDGALCVLGNRSPIASGPWLSYDAEGQFTRVLEPGAFVEAALNVSRLLGWTPCLSNLQVRTPEDYALAAFSSCELADATSPVVSPEHGLFDENDVPLRGASQFCMQDLAGFGLGCTANDIQIAGITNVVITDDGCAFPGDSVTFDATLQVSLTAQARHDIGIYLATDGGDALTGSCFIETLPYEPEPSFLDLDGLNDSAGGDIQDTCGDIDADHNPIFLDITGLTVACIDSDENGLLDLAACTSWRQPGANGLCTSPEQAYPGAPSKCRCETIEVADIQIPPAEISVTKTGSPNPIDEPGEDVTFTVLIENDSPSLSVEISSLADNIFGDLNGQGDCSVPQVIPPLGNYSCSFTAFVSGNAGQTHTNTVTALGLDEEANEVGDSSTETIPIEDVQPAIEVTKAANPTSVDEPGGDVTFSVSVANNSGSTDSVTVTSLVDTVHGDLNGQGDCSVPQTIQPGDSYGCSFTAFLAGNAGDSETDIVTAEGQDDEGTPVSDNDDAIVTINDVLPQISVQKTAIPAEVPAFPGGVPVTFAVSIANDSVSTDPVTISSLTDTVFGDLNGQGDCSVPQTIQPGDTYSCSFVALVTSDHVNEVTANGTDDEGNPVTGSDPATVDAFLFSIDVEKYVSSDGSSWQDADLPGEAVQILAGEPVYFRFAVVNNSERAVDLSLTDSDFNLGDCNPGIPAILGIGESFACEIERTAVPDLQMDRATAVATYRFWTTDDSDDAYYFGVDPELTIDKQVSDDQVDWRDSIEVQVGSMVYYRFVLENTGNVPLEEISVTDPTLAAILSLPSDTVFCSLPSLNVGESYVCPTIYTLGPVEFTGKDSPVVNIATADGCYDQVFCDDDSDNASYVALYVAWTPGFWKTHAKGKKDAWAYCTDDLNGVYITPETLVGEVFPSYLLTVLSPTKVRGGRWERRSERFANNTLLEALTFQGGKGTSDEGAVEILLRAAVASLMNACYHQSVGNPVGGPLDFFPLTMEDVVDEVGLALGDTLPIDRPIVLELAGLLDSYNNGIGQFDWTLPIPTALLSSFRTSTRNELGTEEW